MKTATFKRIMIALDFSSSDQPLLRYSRLICGKFSPENVYFINVQEDLDVPDEIRAMYPAFDYPRDEQCRNTMRDEVSRYFGDQVPWKMEFKVLEGSPRKEILHWVHIKNADLLIAGKKEGRQGDGVLPRQLARKLQSSLLIVPDSAPRKVDKLLVCSDFSDHAFGALRTALGFASCSSLAKVDHLHVYSVPPGYYRTGKTEEEFAEIMAKHATKRFRQFCADLTQEEKARVSSTLLYNDKRRSPSHVISEYAREQAPDLILLGPRGRSKALALFLGSVAEKILNEDIDVPIFLVKDKQNTFDIMDLIDSI